MLPGDLKATGGSLPACRVDSLPLEGETRKCRTGNMWSQNADRKGGPVESPSAAGVDDRYRVCDPYFGV